VVNTARLAGSVAIVVFYPPDHLQKPSRRRPARNHA